MSERLFVFRFSPVITISCLLLSALMVKASTWQWDRYKKKVALVESYAAHSSTEPLDFPLSSFTGNSTSIPEQTIAGLLYKKVRLKGTFDFDRALIVTNRKDISGPGHLLFVPFRISGSDYSIMISRGFIPFEDRTPETWEKYRDDSQEVEIQGVVQSSAVGNRLGPKNPMVGNGAPYARLWYFPQLEKMAEQLPYPIVTSIFLQKLGEPIGTKYPSEYVRIEVPPSTHFGYTIEWAILAFVTILSGIGLQFWPKRRARYSEIESEGVTQLQ